MSAGPNSDALANLLAELLAEALDVDQVTLELHALACADLPIHGHHARPVHVAGCAETTDPKTLSIATPHAQLRIERRGTLPPSTATRAQRFAELLDQAASRIMPPPGTRSIRDELLLIKEHRVVEALQRTRWNVVDAARFLGVRALFVYRVVKMIRARVRAPTRTRLVHPSG